MSCSLRSGLCIAIPEVGSTESESALESGALMASTFTPSNTQSVVKSTAASTSLLACNTHSHRILKPFAQRSSTGMRGLLLAETGGGLVELDLLGSGSGFKQGTAIVPGLVTPGGGTSRVYPSGSLARRRKISPKAENTVTSQLLSRQATLLSHDVTSARNAAELKSLLGNSKMKIKSGATLLPPMNPSPINSSTDPGAGSVLLEQGKSRSRVEVDILLDSEVCVEGGYLRGRLLVKIRNVRGKEAIVLLAGGKMRVVGYEGIPDNNDRHTFYQHSAPLSAISASSHILYSSSPDEEGFSPACEGQHIIPFEMRLPISEDVHLGAKGPFDSRSGVVVRYIAIASFKLKDSSASKHSIAHFYRSCEIYPYFNSALVLAPAAHPLLSAAARSVFRGGPGKLKLTASLHRNIWIAGQRCCVGITVDNESKKSVKGLTLGLIRTITIFRPRPNLAVSSPSSDKDACQTTTTRKLVMETTLEAGQRGLRGHVTEKGWWVGVDPGVQARSTHFILLPHDALSIVRSRLVQVSYAIRVSLIAGSLSSEVSVMLPLRIINSLSIDPPPSYPTPSNYPKVHAPVPLLSVQALDSATATSISLVAPQFENFQGSRFRTVPDLVEPRTMSDKVIAPGDRGSDTTGDDDTGQMHIQRSQIMPRLDEEGSDVQTTKHYLASSSPRSDGSESSRSSSGMTHDRNVSDDVSGDSEVTDGIDIDDLTIDLLRKLNSDDGHDSFRSSIELDGDSRHECNTSVTTADIPQAVGFRNESQTGPNSYGLSSLPKDLTIHENITAITNCCHTSPLKGPIGKTPAGSTEAHVAARHTETSSVRSWQGSSPFSQRVESLVAARHAAAPIPNSTTMGKNIENRSVPVDKGKQPQMTLSTLTRPDLCAAPAAPTSSIPSIGCPLSLTSSLSQMVTSDGGNTVAGSGSVRSRVAALEGRAGIAVAGRPDFVKGGSQGRAHHTS